MIAQARKLSPKDSYPDVKFEEGGAEDLPFVESGSVDMVVAGQAAHWFDFAKLWPEMRRILRPGGTLAFWGYKDSVLVDFPRASEILHRHSHTKEKGTLGSYWSQPGRGILEDKLRAIRPPEEIFEDVQRVEYEPGTEGKGSGEGTRFVERRMKVGEAKAYLRTWSSTHGWMEANPGRTMRAEGGPGDIVDEIWGEMVEADPALKDDDLEVDVEWGTGLLMARKKS